MKNLVMNKTFAKPLAAATALALAMSLSPLAAFAQTPGGNDVADTPFTVTGIAEGDTVKAYQVFDADIDASNNLTYTAKVSGLPEAYDTIGEISAQKDGRVVANAIAPAVTATEATYSGVADENGQVTFKLDSGYYLVTVTTTSGNTKLYQTMLVNASPAIDAQGQYAPADLESIAAKSENVPAPTKVIVNGDGPTTKATDQYSVGDTVKFRIDGTIPSYPSDATNVTYILTDTPDKGLSVDKDSFVIKDAKGEVIAPYYYELLVGYYGTYSVRFLDSYVKGHTGQAVTVEYSAVVSSIDKITGKVGNQVTGMFNPNPYDETTVKTEPDKVTDQTYGFTFKKVGKDDQGNTNALAEAEFTIYDADGNVVTYMDPTGGLHEDGKVLSDSNGYVYANGLQAGTYTIKETKVPSGYQKVNDFTIILDESDTSDSPATADVQETNFDITTADVVDPKQGSLPTTGGAGTIALTAGGILLVVGGSVVILRSRRRSQM